MVFRSGEQQHLIRLQGLPKQAMSSSPEALELRRSRGPGSDGEACARRGSWPQLAWLQPHAAPLSGRSPHGAERRSGAGRQEARSLSLFESLRRGPSRRPQQQAGARVRAARTRKRHGAQALEALRQVLSAQSLWPQGRQVASRSAGPFTRAPRPRAARHACARPTSCGAGLR